MRSLSKHKSSGIFISLAWPDTQVVWTNQLYESLLRTLLQNYDNRIRVGHAAAIVIDRTTGEMDYLDFGRYITPNGRGRVRSKETDSDIAIPIKAQFDSKGELSNLDEILRFFEAAKFTHGEGRMIASACYEINYDRAMRYVRKLQNRGAIAYGPFVYGGSNCSRFVADALYAGCINKKVRLKLAYPISITPSPLGTVLNADTTGVIWEVDKGNITEYRGGKLSAIKDVFTSLGMKRLNRESKATKDYWLMGTLHEPERPSILPERAKWFGGIGSGAWFYLSKPEGLKKDEFRFQRINPEGEFDCDRVFKPKIGKFNFDAPFELTYETNCLFCTVIQFGEKIILESVREFGAERSCGGCGGH